MALLSEKDGCTVSWSGWTFSVKYVLGSAALFTYLKLFISTFLDRTRTKLLLGHIEESKGAKNSILNQNPSKFALSVRGCASSMTTRGMVKEFKKANKLFSLCTLKADGGGVKKGQKLWSYLMYGPEPVVPRPELRGSTLAIPSHKIPLL